MRRLVIGDRKVRVRDEGESSRCPLVLIHGAAGSSVSWMDAVRRLPGQRRVVAPDLPGHGQSDRWPEASLTVYRDFIGTVCATLGIERAVLGGHSMGGAIALSCALAWPDKVAGLVLVATGGRLKVSPAIYTMLETAFAEFPEQFKAWAYSAATPVDVVDRWSAVAVQAEADVCLADFRALDGFDVRPRLAELRMPSLVVGGEDDRLTPPKLQQELAAGLGSARLALLPHAGHHPMHEQPQRFFAALEAFLVDVP